jgi:hypothetical protein
MSSELEIPIEITLEDKLLAQAAKEAKLASLGFTAEEILALRK